MPLDPRRAALTVGLAAAATACGGASSARLEIDRDTLVLYGPGAATPPVRLIRGADTALRPAQAAYLLSTDTVVSVRDGMLACVGTGTVHVSVSVSSLRGDFVVRCERPTRFELNPFLDLVVGAAPIGIPVRARMSSDEVQTIAHVAVTVSDTTIVRVQNGQLVPRAVGRTLLSLDVGGATIPTSATVREVLVADTLVLSAGEERTWTLPPGRYAITVRPVHGHSEMASLDLTTEGARCVRDRRSDETVHCFVVDSGAVSMRNSDGGGLRQRAVLSVVRTP